MAEPGLIGHITSDDEKKRKDGGGLPLILPFTSPSYHLLLGGADSRHEEVLGALIQNAILAGNNIVAFDTTGMVVPFLLPFLPGDHVRKARGLKERLPPGLVENMRPAGIFFNSPVEESTGSAIKGWFSLPKILLDGAKLDAQQEETLKKAFGISKNALMKDVLQSVVAVAFGKDYIKVKAKAIAFVDYLVASFGHLAAQGLPYPTWVHAREALFSGNNAVPKPTALTEEDVNVFGRTLDFYITNALLFKPSRPGPTNMDQARMDQKNFFLFYLQDMNEREQALALALLFAQHAIGTVTNQGSHGDPISVAMRHGRLALAFDEIGIILQKGHPVLQPLASAIGLLREAAIHGCSLLMATRAATGVDLGLLASHVLVGPTETNIYVGKLKEKGGLDDVVSWLGSKGAKVSTTAIESLKSSQALLVPLNPAKEPVRFDVLESSVMSVVVSPSMLKTMLSTPILVSKKPSTVPSPHDETHVVTGGGMPSKVVTTLLPQQARIEPKVAEWIKSVPEASPVRSETEFPAVLRSPKPPVEQEGSAPPSVWAFPIQPLAPSIASTPHPVTKLELTRTQTMIPPETKPNPSPSTERLEKPIVPSSQPPQDQKRMPVVEELLDQYEPDESDSDEGPSGNIGDVQGDMSSDLDFLSRLLGAEKATIGERKISRMDYNMALNALLFKLEKVVKASFGVQFFKELMSSKSMSYDRAMEMYYQESNAMLKGKFAVQRGGSIAYQGIKESVRAIIGELGLQIPVPADEDLKQLEIELVKALDMPRHELLQRIKDGSLYF